MTQCITLATDKEIGQKISSVIKETNKWIAEDNLLTYFVACSNKEAFLLFILGHVRTISYMNLVIIIKMIDEIIFQCI